MEHVDDADDLLVLIPDGGHHRGDVLAKALPQGVECGVVVAVVLVGLGDIEHPGHGPVLTVLPGLLGAHAHAALGRADNNGRAGDLQALKDLAHKVEVARSVNDIDFAALILHRGHGEGDGNLALNLLGVIITNGVAVSGTSQPIGSAGQIQHTLCQGGLSVSTVAQQADIADVLCGIAHTCFLSLLFGVRIKNAAFGRTLLH